MKKQLILCSAILAATSVTSQNGHIKTKPSGFKNMAENIAAKFAIENSGNISSNLKPSEYLDHPENVAAEKSAVTMPPSTINWNLLCGSANVYGMLVSQSRPLQYNPNVNAISFIHRKSTSYQYSPAIPANAESGIIVAEITSDWGLTWDSTCIWSDATNWGRYPQGAIYSAPGNTNVANAYVVGCGPTVAGANFSGNWYASKKLAAPSSTLFNSTLDPTPGAQQFLSFSLPTYPANQGPHGWSRYGFSSTDDGAVRSLALIQNDQTGLSTMRGFSIVKGTFNAGAFTWTTDSIIPATILKNDGTKHLSAAPQMAWNKAGTVGYVVCIGAAAGSTLSNKSYQPIIYKTTNSGASWSALPYIDFNSPTMSFVTDHLANLQPPSTNTNISAPWFVDFDITVDANNDLHIAAQCASTASDDNDQLTSVSQFTTSINPGENYLWAHTPGNHPYLYDFIGNGTAAWKLKVVDSIATEDPSSTPGGDGFNDNPWDATGTGGVKVNVDRVVLGRTPDGSYITYSWVESDTNFTNGGRKWNSLPNIKTRCMAIGSGTNMYQISPTEINVSKISAGTGTLNTNVANRATLHYLSPTTGSASVFINAATSTYTVDINTPITVTNSNPLSQLTNNSTWIQTGKLSYAFTGTATATGTTNIGFAENSINSVNNSVIFPNPSSENTSLAIDLKDNSTVNVVMVNALGQVVKTTSTQGKVGQNNISINLSGLSAGIYFTTVKVDNATNTKKLIVR
ncbi:MAG: T9SS type A sorting domain-containing protein [Bacteroidia bacterium]|nr:T9SS type A sorting domain-containing protein [Bacteroidia bacterium]